MQSLTGIVKHYDWGSSTAIPALLRHAEDGTPWAEYWLGTHSGGVALVVDAPGTPLDSWLDRHPTAMGTSGSTRFGPHLPYLLKVLAADQPLSLQAHPSRAQAVAWYAAEEARGIAPDDPMRNFKDAWPKPEMIVALTPFAALSGFRDPARTLQLFAALGVDEVMRPTLAPLRFRDGAPALGEVFLDCLTLDDTRRVILDEVLAAAVRHVGDDGPTGTFARLAVTLDEHHPGDSSLLAALLLNYVELAPGEGLYNGPGVLHSYLFGTGIEIMAQSDNVLRAGLTNKHVDHATLTSIVNFTPAPPAIVDADTSGPVRHFSTPDPEFQLWRLEPASDTGQTPLPGAGLPRVLLVVDGHVVAQGTQTAELLQGESAFIGADETVTFSGHATAFLAAPGV